MADNPWTAFITSAKNAGYSDGEIAHHILSQDPSAKAALADGYSVKDVLTHLGLGTAPPKDFKPDYEGWAKKGGLSNPDLLRALIQHESSGNPNAVGDWTASGHAGGIAQIMPADAAKAGINPFDPEQAGPYAAKRLADSLTRYGGDLDKTLMEYHGGQDEKNWGPKTKAYPSQVKQWLAPGSKAAAVAQNAPMAQPVEDSSELDAKLHALARREGTPPAPAEPELDAKLREMAPAGPASAQPGAAPPPEDSKVWGNFQQVASGLNLGYGPEIRAGQYALGRFFDRAGPQGIRDAAKDAFGLGKERKLSDLVTGDESPSDYRYALDYLHGEQAKHAAYAPWGSTLSELGGSIPTTALGTATGGEVLGLLGNAAVRAAPRLAPIFNGFRDFVAGRAGTAGAANATRDASGVALDAPGAAGVGTRLLSRGGQGLLTGEAGALLDSHMSPEDIEDQVANGGYIGATTNALLGPVGGRMLRAILPPRASVPAARLAAGVIHDSAPGAADAIPLTTKQVVSANSGTAAARTPGQEVAFTRRVWNTLIPPDEQAQIRAAAEARGAPAPDFQRVEEGGVNLRAAADWIGDKFTRVANSVSIGRGDPTFSQDLRRLQRDIHNVNDANSRASAQRFYDVLDDARLNPATGGIDGPAYQELTQRGSRIANGLVDKDPLVRGLAIQARNVLDSALQRSATRSGQGEMVGLLAQARSQWRDLQVLEDASKHTAKTDGLIDPPKLLPILQQHYKNYAQGGTGALQDLGAVGARFLANAPRKFGGMRPEPRDFARPWTIPITADLFGAGAALASTPFLAENAKYAGATALALGAHAGVNAATGSRWYRDRLIRDALHGPQVPNMTGGRSVVPNVITGLVNGVGEDQNGGK